jgi:predicted transcriptional regulator
MNSAHASPRTQGCLPAAARQSRRPAAELRQQAVALRRAGQSRREIAQLLGITSKHVLDEALRGEPPPEWTRRPNAKDGLHAQARELRVQGLSYEEIAGVLGVSKSSVSLWVRDLPRPPHLSYEESRKRSAEGARRYWAAQRPIREARRESERAAAAAGIGALSRREILIAGAIAYWCEGAKSKPHNPCERVVFINSDPRLIQFFLAFLGEAGVKPAALRYRVNIHESANVTAAEQYWQGLTGAGPEQFHRTTLKKHNPRTPRKNVGADYHGCLIVEVRQSAWLYRRIEGWVRAATAPGAVRPPVFPPDS